MKTFSTGRSLLRLAVAVACLTAPFAVPDVAFAGDADVIARVGATEVKVAEVRGFIESLDQRQQAAITGNPAALSQVVRQLLAQRAVLQEAMAKKWDKRPEVQAQLERARGMAIAESYLASVTNPPDNYPTDADLQAGYEANQAAFLVPRQFELAQIFVALPRAADGAAEKAARAKLDKIQKRLKQPKADFGAIANEESDDKSAVGQGGKMPWLTETQIMPEIRTAVAGLAKGAVAEPVRLDDGWHILKLVDTKPASTRPLAEVRDQLVQQLRAERSQDLRRTMIAKMLEQNPVAINELELEKLRSKPTK